VLFSAAQFHWRGIIQFKIDLILSVQIILSSCPRLFLSQQPAVVQRSVATASDELDALYQRLEVEVRGHDPAVLKSYEWYACQAAEQLGVKLKSE
jgi:hypothetical protein